MDKPTIEYLVTNLAELTASMLAGTGIGYVNSRLGDENRFVDKSESSKLGYAALLTFISNPVNIGISHLGLFSVKRNMMEVAQGDIGSIVGFYVGFHIGKAIDKGLSRIYSPKDTTLIPE